MAPKALQYELLGQAFSTVGEVCVYESLMIVCMDATTEDSRTDKLVLMRKSQSVNYQTLSLGKKAVIPQPTAMVSTSKDVLFPGDNHLLTTGADDPTLWLLLEHQRVKAH